MHISQSAIAVVAGVCLISPARPASAQVQRGAIYGTVEDRTRAVLPGVVVRLTSDVAAPQETTTGGRGEFRFGNLDPGAYTAKATLSGFAPLVRPAIVVGVGSSVEITIEMVITQLTEEVVVTSASPVLDLRRQGNVVNFDRVMLNEIPTARDPWALMQQLPGVSIGRPNVGGSESTNQAQFAARGDNGSNTMWNIDGVTITDMATLGGSTTYYDFNAFEEVQFTTGSLDARQQTGGLGINLVTKRGTNVLHSSGRLYFTNDALQGENISPELGAAGLSGNRIRQLADYGGDIGGPLRKDRLWFWAAVARNDVRQLAINGFPDNTVINTDIARTDAQVTPATRLSFLFHRAQKLKDGRGAGLQRPPETTWSQGGGTDIYKAEGSHVFGRDLLLSAKFAFVDEVFSLTPKSGLQAQAYRDFARQVWHGGFTYSSSDRTQYQTQIDGQWSRGRHEVAFGFQHRLATALEKTGWPGDGTFTMVNVEAQGVPSGSGFAMLTRAQIASSETGTVSAYAGDVIATGRWTINLGLRIDRQRGRSLASQAPANGLAPSILPALEYPGGQETVWRDLSPRVGVTRRLNDRTIVRASYARFPSQLSGIVIGFNNPARLGSIQYLFADTNGDHLAQGSELVGPTGSVSGINPVDPSAPYSPNQVDPNLSAPIAQVLVGGLEREVMPNFLLGVSFGHSYLTGATWSPFLNLTRGDFVEYRTAGTSSVPSSTPVYRLVPGVSLPPGNGRVLTNRDGYHQRYWNVDVTATKRLANRWMFRGFVTVQQQREYFDDPARSIQDPTPLFDQFLPVASGLRDGGLAVNLLPSSDFIIQAKWIYSVAGLYELPWGVSIAGTLYGRQGYPAVETITVNRPDGLGLTGVLIDSDLDAKRYASPRLLDVRLQKALAWGRFRPTLDLDLFNVLNNAVVLRQFSEGTSVSFRNPQEIVAPRLVRLGLQLRF